MTVAKPASRPNVPHFSSGPCAKRPGWNPQNLKDAALGRYHRGEIGKAVLQLAVQLTRETGAVEMALWALRGARPVTTISWASVRESWVGDTVKKGRLNDVTRLHAGYG